MNEDTHTCYSIEGIVTHILQIVRESLMGIYFYGRQRRQDECNTSKNVIFTGDLPDNAIMDIFNRLYLRSSINDYERFGRIPEVRFDGYGFTELPPNVGRVMLCIKRITYANCEHLSSLATTFAQFPQLNHLACQYCPSLTSLASLWTMPQESLLVSLQFRKCGLRITADDRWEDGMMALARSAKENVCLRFRIESCDFLTRIPSSIKYLNDRKVSISLCSNLNLRMLPVELGEVKRLERLSICNCPVLHNLPRTLSKIPRCTLRIRQPNGFLSDVLRRCVIPLPLEDYWVAVEISQLEIFFEAMIKAEQVISGVIKLLILYNGSQKRAVYRIYRPGGEGFKRSRRNFEVMTVAARSENKQDNKRRSL